MSKLSSNPHFGRPSPSKLKQRIKGWQVWARGMALRARIEAENLPKLTAMRQLLEVEEEQPAP